LTSLLTLSDALLPDQGIMEGTDEVPDKSSHDSEDGGRENEVSEILSASCHNQVRFLEGLPQQCVDW
jgi:hypothetical protein